MVAVEVCHVYGWMWLKREWIDVLPGLSWWFVDVGNVIASYLHLFTVAGR